MQPRRRGSPPFNTFFHVTNKGLQKEKPTKHTPPTTPWPTLKLLRLYKSAKEKKTNETTQSHPTNPGTNKKMAMTKTITHQLGQ
jgi:hypothetical protein